MSSIPPEPAIGESEAKELLVVASDMVVAIDNLREEMSGLKRRGVRYYRLLRMVTISLLFDLLLSVGLAVVLARTNSAAQIARRASSAQTVACRAGNETRRIQTDLWNTILASPPPVGETEARRIQREEQVAKFRVYIADAFLPQDCDP